MLLYKLAIVVLFHGGNIMKNFAYYASIARNYEVPEQGQCPTFQKLIQSPELQKQFNENPKRDEWCKSADSSNVFYIIDYSRTRLHPTAPILTLKYVGKEMSPVISIKVNR